jgi:hypothetical protein
VVATKAVVTFVIYNKATLVPMAKIKCKALFLKDLNNDQLARKRERQSGSGKGFPLWQKLNPPSLRYAPRFKGGA